MRINKFNANKSSIFNISGDTHKLHKGYPSFLKVIQEDLSNTIFKIDGVPDQLVKHIHPETKYHPNTVAGTFKH